MDYIATDGSTSYSGNNINQMYSDISESIIQQVGSEINVTLDSITRTVNVQEDEIVYFSGIGCDPWNYRDLTITNNFQGDGEGEVYYEKVRLHICRTNPWTTEAGIDQLCLNCDYFECGVNPDLCGGQTADCGSCVGDRNHCIDGFCECNNPRTCAGEGVECGYINDGCGDQIYCGPCADYPNSECVSGTCQCNPYTSCSALSCECGVIGDGCGGDLNCSDCASPYEDCSECQCESNPCEFGSSNFGECLFQ